MGRLVLTRRIGESIIIGKDIVITVTKLRTDSVALLCDAPSEVQIDRKEIREAKEAKP